MNLSQRERTLIRVGIIVGVAVLLFVVYISPSISKIRSARRSYEFNMEQYEEFVPLSERYVTLRGKLEEEKRGLGRSKVTQDTFRDTFIAILSDIGLSGEAFEIQFGGSREKGELREFVFNIEGKEITYLEFLNLVRRIEEGSEGLVIKEARVKPTFESDKYLNLSLKLSVISI